MTMASVANASSASVSSKRSAASSVRSKRSSASKKVEPADLKDGMSSTEYIGEVSASIGSAASVASHRSAASRGSASSKRSSSSKASAKAHDEDDGLAERLRKVSAQAGLTSPGVDSSASSWHSPCVSSTASTSHASASHASVASGRSSTSRSSRTSQSSRTSKTSSTVPAANLSKTQNPTPYSDASSISSHRSSASSSTSGKGGKASAKGQQAEAIDHLESGNYPLAILLFTQALGGHPPRADKQTQPAAGALCAYRAEALCEVGAYEAAARDARTALDCERRSRDAAGDRPYASPSGGSSRGWLHPEKGAALRVRALRALGRSLLRGGRVEGAARAFRDCVAAATTALEDEEDRTEGARTGSGSHARAVRVAKEALAEARRGGSELERYEALKARLDAGSHGKECLSLLDEALEVAPAAVELHVQKAKHLIRRRRWFAVANHCEQLAASAAKCEGIYVGDLEDCNPFPGVPSLQELRPDFFSENGQGPPPHLRKLPPAAARDAAFRLPPALLPHYLRALRLEERYKEAVLAGTALAEFDAAAESRNAGAFAANKRFEAEWDKLDRTIELKEEADALFRDAYYERALALYGECLAVDGDKDGSILKQASSWPVASPKPNEAGGKLHAVLHSNRAACFSSLGRYDDAIKECSHALEIHSMYTRALLRRARCYAKIDQHKQARADFDRYVLLVEGAREHPYPPPHQGSACYFDMPSEVTAQQLRAVKREMGALGMRPMATERGKGRSRWDDFLERASRAMPSMSSMSCCRKNAASQVVTQPSHWPEQNGSGRRTSSRSSSGGLERRVSWNNGPPPQSYRPDPPNDSLIKPRPAFDHPLDPPSAIDAGVDYYATLGLLPSASDAEIKHAYHKLAREWHPDRNGSLMAQSRFQEVKMAYAILGESKKKREYDKAKFRIDP